MKKYSQNYPELLNSLYQVSRKKKVELGLQNIKQLSAHFGNPHQKFRSVHVAGTNGKGSVCVKTARCLEDAGFRVGLFTSPHISSFRERIRINGELISEEAVVKHLTAIFETALPATFFEITTMLAFNYFAEQNIEYAVLETGMGGRLDATNCVTPKLSIITSISLDHTEFLGKTVEEIGYEKAGIIKPGIPAILGPCTPGVPRSPLCQEVTGIFNNPEEENQAIVKAALELLRIPISEGIHASLPCRFEQISFDGVPVILDVAHNPDGLQRLFQRLGDTPFRAICGLSKSKDISECLEIIRRHTKNIHFVVAPNGRGVPLPNAQPIKTAVLEAVKAAKTTEETVLICGSCFIMEEVRAALGFNEPRDPLPVCEIFPNVVSSTP